MKTDPHQNPSDEPIRKHSFDGIQEYDKRLPNWWLFTLYGAIAFGFAYWVYYEYPRTLQPSGARVDAEMARIVQAAESAGGQELTDDQLWAKSRDASVISVGETTFQSTCASCHNSDLHGKIGPNLTIDLWLHGGLPHEVVRTITNGVAAKGMPPWGPLLGKAKIIEVAAFVMSHHKQGEPILDASKMSPAELTSHLKFPPPAGGKQ
jgi:cytochrome c oxidase cbb3-type subunit 3